MPQAVSRIKLILLVLVILLDFGVTAFLLKYRPLPGGHTNPGILLAGASVLLMASAFYREAKYGTPAKKAVTAKTFRRLAVFSAVLTVLCLGLAYFVSTQIVPCNCDGATVPVLFSHALPFFFVGIATLGAATAILNLRRGQRLEALERVP